MKTIIQTILICLFLSNTALAQTTYTGILNLNKKDNLTLVSGTDSIRIEIGKKKLDITKKNQVQFSQTKRNNYILQIGDTLLTVSESKRQITYSSGIYFIFDKKTAKKLRLKDEFGKIALEADYTFKYPSASYKVTLFGNTHPSELIAYATYYLINKSKELKTAYDTPYVFFTY
jgi:hypothetical protein